jgi:hypothetical protein
MKRVKGRNGGTLLVLEKGDQSLPGNGRKKNPFREAIQAIAESESLEMTVEGRLIVDGVVTDDIVKVRISAPSAQAVVWKMYREAKKGNVPAAKWLTETGFGKTVNLGEDPDNPLGGGFAVILPDNKR